MRRHLALALLVTALTSSAHAAQKDLAVRQGIREAVDGSTYVTGIRVRRVGASDVYRVTARAAPAFARFHGIALPEGAKVSFTVSARPVVSMPEIGLTGHVRHGVISYPTSPTQRSFFPHGTSSQSFWQPDKGGPAVQLEVANDFAANYAAWLGTQSR